MSCAHGVLQICLQNECYVPIQHVVVKRMLVKCIDESNHTESNLRLHRIEFMIILSKLSCMDNGIKVQCHR